MGILSNKLVIGLIVLVVLTVFIMLGFYFGVRWASQDVSELNDGPDQLTVDLEQTRIRLKDWSKDFLNQFPDVPAVKATVENHREILREVTARNEELRQKGLSTRRRIKQLTQLAEEISGPIAERTRFSALHLELMRENKALKEKIDRYMHTNLMLPVPLYLLGLNKMDLEILQKEFEASQNRHGGN
jgi:flagellar basal body-associated protein FliL